MQYLELSHRLSANIGDEIQSIAAGACLPRVDGHVDRDHLNEYEGPLATVVLNGWFGHRPLNWPPAPSLRPIFVGFHLTDKATPHYASTAQYLREHQPIGCRDERTAEILRSWSVDASTVFCATLTLPRRERTPVNGLTALVDVRDIHIPRSIRRRGVKVTHKIPEFLSHGAKMAHARDLLAFYREQASVVVTSRLHCALPCAAMGIPVVFFGDPHETRISILTEIGIPIHDSRRHARLTVGLPGLLERSIDWSPEPVDVTRIGERIRAEIGMRLS